ncbi:MAG: hypothetical protein COA86_04215 [Kangiella sp.]|nr:MAG: hypothetical protein COA86_04215 [Kangiella sp.]
MLKEIISMFSEKFSKNDDNSETFIKDHYLYHYSSCPFCFRVSIGMKKLGINMEKRNIHEGTEYYNELKNGGGNTMVPCLRIDNNGESKWLYESADIMRYLENNFASND